MIYHGSSICSGRAHGDVLYFIETSASNISTFVFSPLSCIYSINYEWSGTFHLHEYLVSTNPSMVPYLDTGAPLLRHPHGRLPACVTDGKLGDRITPREAEKRAGKGSRKAWKQTLLTSVEGSDITLQKFMTMLGVEGGSTVTGGMTPATALRKDRSSVEDSADMRMEGSGDPMRAPPPGATVPVLPAMNTMAWMTGDQAASFAMQQVGRVHLMHFRQCLTQNVS